jgi:ADP-ribose pyrophosphatase YjhB (NUDIX family)
VKPELGKWYLPAGFVEYDESPAEAAVREVREETGLDIALEGLLGVYQFGDQRHGRGNLILYRARVVGGKLEPGDDADAVGFFGPDELPEDIAFDSTREALRAWREGKWTTTR